MNLKKIKLAVIGLGYAGLPLALEFAKKRNVVGYDINLQRIKNLKIGFDKNKEFSKKQIKKIKKIQFTNNQNDLADCNFFIISVPTPITKSKIPDLKILKFASRIVGKFVKKNDIIIYESTVYPGVTE
jgi:UDP-N-acetyl-D-galactosamine dehydrogenase